MGRNIDGRLCWLSLARNYVIVHSFSHLCLRNEGHHGVQYKLGLRGCIANGDCDDALQSVIDYENRKQTRIAMINYNVSIVNVFYKRELGAYIINLDCVGIF